MQATSLAASFLLLTGSVALTGPEKFPCKATCISVFFSQISDFGHTPKCQHFGIQPVSGIFTKIQTDRTWLCMRNLGAESGRELFKDSKNAASLLVCTGKKWKKMEHYMFCGNNENNRFSRIQYDFIQIIVFSINVSLTWKTLLWHFADIPKCLPPPLTPSLNTGNLLLWLKIST